MRRAVLAGMLAALVVLAEAGPGVSGVAAPGPAALGAAVRVATAPATSFADPWNLDIDRAMDVVGVVPGMVVGEAGAGDGYFTLPMARRVGASGAVYANDISRRALDRLARNAEREGLSNIQTVEGAVDDPLFPRRDLELVVVVHAFHDFDRPVAWLVNLRQYLRPGGVVAIIDRDPGQGGGRHFLSRERILGYAAEGGYEQTKLVDDISRHLIIVLRPRPSGR